jgi:hypothetical protein
MSLTLSVPLDLFSFTKERLTNSSETNIITMLQRLEGVPSEKEAILAVRNAIFRREFQVLEAREKVLRDPVFGADPEVRRWMMALQYLASGNCCKEAC